MPGAVTLVLLVVAYCPPLLKMGKIWTLPFKPNQKIATCLRICVHSFPTSPKASEQTGNRLASAYLTVEQC